MEAVGIPRTGSSSKGLFHHPVHKRPGPLMQPHSPGTSLGKRTEAGKGDHRKGQCRTPLLNPQPCCGLTGAEKDSSEADVDS